ncbi:FAD-binding oxidoreductase [Bradyrhizobium cenepequi]|uniref:FAD-binding oxidoreductase n=1 Tax=Bradyrhizobium cenepequi TaxID=2821403 RepID=UPI001CE2D593|nr:FAD-binding oxidoreductase [Bradyrhizobium cenepequi]MCA6109274.1 2Fe-2S iron-sulfur cluster binding domain-containing protein [Bradyrhizobium cenepequi]
MTIRDGDGNVGSDPPEPAFWGQLFAGLPAPVVVADGPAGSSTPQSETLIRRRNTWIDRLFAGEESYANSPDKIIILQNGVEIEDVPIDPLGSWTVVGRHPRAHIQLEAYKLGLFHAAFHKKDDRFYLRAIDLECGALLDRKKIKAGVPVPLRDGSLVDIPGYQLRIRLANSPAAAGEEIVEAEELAEIPSYFYVLSPPPSSPGLTNRIEDRAAIALWSGGVTSLKVVDIIEETADAKTFRLVGEKPLLFSYRPGQFVTLLLTIDGEYIERSYSISSSPSRPHVLELTVKRVPGGRVSNWLCDHVMLGGRLTIKGPAGKFSCFDCPASKMLFIGAGSGITPMMSMSRWIVDTTADLDVKFLASFKSPADIIFRKELELISARHACFRVAVTLTSARPGRTESWTGLTGRFDKSMIHALVPDLDQRHVFLCGPEPFAAEVRRILQELGFDQAKLHSESFGSGRVAGGGTRVPKPLALSEPRHRVHFIKSDRTVETDETVTLLELAEAHGIEMDYACRTGSCAECEVSFTGALSEKPEFEKDRRRKENGIAFACCSVALSDLEVEA